MKFIITIIISIATYAGALAQGCPATNGTFATATLFNPSWISACSSGTSCTGGTAFDNRTTCDAVTIMDVCAPTPSCGTAANNASDLWFKFYSTATTATITVNPSVSMKSAIQAFSINQATPTCASLIQIGCALASGVSTGCTISLTGLVVGNLYYFRVYGNASNAAQRNGTFCFCGSAGLASAPLAANLTSFAAAAQNNNIYVKWSTASGSSALNFYVERGYDGIHFSTIGTAAANTNTQNSSSYQYTDIGQYQSRIFYRLKTNNLSGQPEYSGIIRVNQYVKSLFTLEANVVKEALIIDARESINIRIVNSAGALYLSKTLQPGINNINTKSLPNGTYFIKNIIGEETKKFIIQH